MKITNLLMFGAICVLLYAMFNPQSKINPMKTFHAAATSKAQPIESPYSNPTAGRDPAEGMRIIAIRFPRSTTDPSTGETVQMIDVSYDVRKTDSLVNPMIGYLNFSEHLEVFDFKLQMIFHREGDEWRFVSLIGRETGNNFTDQKGGIESRPAMKEFLAHFR